VTPSVPQNLSKVAIN